MKFRATLSSIVIVASSISMVGQDQSTGPKDTFAASKLSAAEIHDIVAETEKSAYDFPDSWVAELRVKRVDLGATTGIVVRGSNLLCGATANCQTWVFRKVGNHLVSLFEGEQAPIAESFRFEAHTTAGIKDLTIRANSSAEAVTSVTYAFDGHFYRPKK